MMAKTAGRRATRGADCERWRHAVSRWIEDAGLVATGMAIVTGGGAILGALRLAYRATVGRRRVLASKLSRLAPGMQMAYFEQLLGVPSYKTRDDSGRQDMSWVERDAYVQASAVGETVVVMSVTTRNGRFAPRLYRE